MTEDERPYQAENATQFDDDDFLAAVDAHEPASTKDVAQAVGCSQQTAMRRLKQLEERGAVSSKRAGPAYIWSRA